VIEIERKRGILNSIRYFLAPRDLFETIQKLEQELMDIKVEKNNELKFTRQLLDISEKKIKEKELLIVELKQELAEIKVNAPAKLEEERKRRQSENVHTILNPKQLELFKILSQGEKTYSKILESARNIKLDIHDMAALRLQISRLNGKLKKETTYKVERMQRNSEFFYRMG